MLRATALNAAVHIEKVIAVVVVAVKGNCTFKIMQKLLRKLS